MSPDNTRQRVEQAIQHARGLIGQVRERREAIGEQNTKAVLIDPILEALGWNLRNLDEVVREYRARPSDNPVDYALMLRRSPLLFVEAKDLGSNLSDRKWASQTISYATVVGVEWCVLTDGDEYRIYNAHAPVDVDEKLFRAVRLSDTDAHERTLETLLLLSKEKLAADDLRKLWEAYFVDCQVQRALEEMFKGPDNSLVRLLRKRIPELTPTQVRGSLARADLRISFPDASEATPPAFPPPPEPTEAKVPRATCVVVLDGQRYECRYATEILVHVGNWLVAQGRVSERDCPVRITRGGKDGGRCIINTEPQHPHGGAFISPKRLTNGLYVETNISRRGIEDYAYRLLKWAGVDPGLLEIEWGE